MSHASLIIDRDVAVPMRDGTVLRADVYRPATAGRYPVILQRTPYNKALLAGVILMLDVVRTASEGYAVVIQDTRGRYASEGGFYAFRTISRTVMTALSGARPRPGRTARSACTARRMSGRPSGWRR